MVKDIVADFEQGLTNEQLVGRYQLSHDGLNKLFANLLRAVANGSAEIDLESGG